MVQIIYDFSSSSFDSYLIDKDWVNSKVVINIYCWEKKKSYLLSVDEETITRSRWVIHLCEGAIILYLEDWLPSPKEVTLLNFSESWWWQINACNLEFGSCPQGFQLWGWGDVSSTVRSCGGDGVINTGVTAWGGCVWMCMHLSSYFCSAFFSAGRWNEALLANDSVLAGQ